MDTKKLIEAIRADERILKVLKNNKVTQCVFDLIRGKGTIEGDKLIRTNAANVAVTRCNDTYSFYGYSKGRFDIWNYGFYILETKIENDKPLVNLIFRTHIFFESQK